MATAATNTPIVLTTGAEGDQKIDHAAKRPPGDDPGQNKRADQPPVDIKIDAMPHHTFSGRVDSLQPGTGSNFALLPPDNATGNFIKIVQRIPVKILFDPDSIANVREKIVPGLSTESSIAITEKPTQLPYESITEEKATPPAHKPITQGEGQPAPGAVQ